MSYNLDQWVEKHFPGSTHNRAWQLEGGSSAKMTAFGLLTRDGKTKKLILRQPGKPTLLQNPHAAEEEFQLLQFLHRLGIPAPSPVYVDTAGEFFPTPSLVVEYLEGDVNFAPPDRLLCARQCAALLARIHKTDGLHPDLFFLPKASPGCRELERDCHSSPNTFWQEDRIRSVLSASRLPESRNAPALLHGDFWPGNLLWQGDRLVGVVDWEDAIIGDPLIDLAISRLDFLFILGSDAMHTFTRQYLSLNPIHTTYLPYWDLCAALRLARLATSDLNTWAAFFHPYGRKDITTDTIRNHYLTFITQALENTGKI